VSEASRVAIDHVFSDPGLLSQALTHRSYGTPNNERLEFIGDAVLGFVVALALYERFPGTPEGQLTRVRAHLVSADDGPPTGEATAAYLDGFEPHEAVLRLFQVHAVTEGTDAQAQVSVRLEEEGRIATGQAADTDTLTASAKAYVNALNNLLARKEKSAPNAIASGF